MTLRIYSSYSYGMPGYIYGTSANAALTTVLEGCLVTGFGDQSITITHGGDDYAYVECSQNHGIYGQARMTISGADQAEYNGEHQMLYVDSRHLKFALVGNPITPATGAITARFAGAGWSKPYDQGQDVACFKQGVGGQDRYLRLVNDTQYAMPVYSYESMTSATEGLPNTSVPYAFWQRYNNTTSAAHWIIIATETWFYYLPFSYSAQIQMGFFGDIDAFDPADDFATMLMGDDSHNYYEDDNAKFVGGLKRMTRSYNQLGTYINVTLAPNDGICGTAFGEGNASYPDPITGKMYLSEINVMSEGGRRGKLPNILTAGHGKIFNNRDTFYGTGPYDGMQFIALNLYSGRQAIFRISD